MELTRLEGGMQMLGPRIGVHDGDCLACSRTPQSLLLYFL